MKTIISEIKNQIKNHESIKNSPLEEINNWKRAHYITLAEIISKKLSQSKHLEGNRIFELGNTLSYITLQRFFENSFSESAVNDLRFLKTLHKLCIFLGFYDLNEFILSSNIINNSKKNNDCSKVYCSIVKNLCLEEFEIIKGLPHKTTESLYDYAFKDSNIVEKIKEYTDTYKEANYFFDERYEDAKFELVSCDLIADEKEFKIIKTVENWDYVLHNNENKTIYYKVFNSQTYYLRKDKKGNWKVWNNYNPNHQKLKSTFL